jgi:hypothetical protein
LDVIVRREGYEELWRNVVSATLDKELWPELSSTPILVRAWMKVVKAIPFVGHRLWKSIIELVLKAQMLMMFEQHKYVVWCGHIPLTDWWPTPLWEREPQWVQTAEWDSADFCNKIATSAARAIGRTVLGLSDSYLEYYGSHTIATNPEKSHSYRL